MSMQEFTSKGGELTGRGERYDAFEGEPKAIGGLAGESRHGHGTSGTTGATSGLTGHNTTGTSGTTGGMTGHNSTGTTGTAGGLGDHNTIGTSGTTGGLTGHNSAGTTGTAGGLTGGREHDGYSQSGTSGVGNNTSSSTTGKPSLMDKLNPKVDANGDGKAGFMK